MKTVLPILLFCISGVYAQTIHQNQVNVATLVVDYDTHQYESGNMQYFDCPECSNDILPFVVHYNPPLDFGNISYTLTNGDTVFSAGIIWMGMGSIDHPTDFSSAFPFDHSSAEVIFPTDVVYYDLEGNISTDQNLITDANLAITQVLDLNAMVEFAGTNYQIAAYLYAPTVGMFDPSVAKWIIFLYYNDKQNDMGEQALQPDLKIFPNPANDELYIEQTSTATVLTYEIRSLDGKTISSGKTSDHSINLNAFRSGMYHLVLLDEKQNVLQTKKIIKK